MPGIIVGVFALWNLSALRLPRDKEGAWAVQEFGKLPVVANGRFQPVDSLARNSLAQIREKQTANLEPWKKWNESPRIISATEWLMGVTMSPKQADEQPVFRIDHPEVRSLLRLPEADPQKHQDGKHYSWTQIWPAHEELEKQGDRISQIEPAHRTPFEQAVMKLQSRLFLYMRLKNTMFPENWEDIPKELAAYLKSIEPGVAAFRAQDAEKDYDRKAYDEFAAYVTRFEAMSRMMTPLLVPPHHPERSRDEWMRTGEALIEIIHGHKLHDAVNTYAGMANAFRQGRVVDFNKAVGDYRAALALNFVPELTKAKREHFFNHLETFYKSLVLYVLAFLLACASWFNLSDWLRRAAGGLIILAFVVHTAGLSFRMFLEGRPPVTNLYSSAIFIGWGAVVLGMILERFYRDGIGSVVASSVGFITLIIAHNLSLGGDTMEMMRAVLDTNFWLATHVVVITLGYSSTFVAGFLAIIYLLRGVFTRTLSEAIGKALARMVYGIICFATLFSFVGTVLGGIWADQSWGRFWGWDPKENGALIIVLWNALILHARWGGMVKERGLMNLAVVGNIVTSWSWFGVNMLGIGLHSYGFTDAAFRWLMLFIGSQLLLIALGLSPQHLWLSFRERAASGAASARPTGGPGKAAPATT
ncbi:MAG: cytochrome c biogenesis protein CcsA [Verrucomicrobia bacterium]|nr:cytochrome c biogenesis protein CcsA [Verrucomicrobiota bacterium]